VGTILTIFVVPTVYLWFSRRRVPGEIATPALVEGAGAE
jgi:multidrug efflux pump